MNMPSRSGSFLRRRNLASVCAAAQVLFLFAVANAGAARADANTPATFSAPALVDAGSSFTLMLRAGRAAVKTWMVQWGDGTFSSQASAATALQHVYRKPGLYRISATADDAKVPVVRDYSRLILDDKPAAYFRFGAPLAAPGTDSPPASDDTLSAAPSSSASGLPWGAPAASFGETVTHFSPGLAAPSDRFSIDFWFRSQDLATRQDIVSSAPDAGTQIYFAGGSVHLELPKGAVFSQPLPPARRTVRGITSRSLMTARRSFPIPTRRAFTSTACWPASGISMSRTRVRSRFPTARWATPRMARIVSWDRWRRSRSIRGSFRRIACSRG